MNVSIPNSWIPSLQAFLVLAVSAGFLFDRPLVTLVALAASAIIMTQDDGGVPKEHRPVTLLLGVAGVLFLAGFVQAAWAVALVGTVLSLAALFGQRPYALCLAELDKRGLLRASPRHKA